MSVNSTKVIVAIEKFNHVLEHEIISHRDTFIDRTTKTLSLKLIKFLDTQSKKHLVDNRRNEAKWKELRNRYRNN